MKVFKLPALLAALALTLTACSSAVGYSALSPGGEPEHLSTVGTEEMPTSTEKPVTTAAHTSAAAPTATLSTVPATVPSSLRSSSGTSRSRTSFVTARSTIEPTRCSPPYKDPVYSSLSAYRDAMMSMSDPDKMAEQLSPYPSIAKTIRYRLNRYFPMMVEDHFFLLPQLPKGYTVTGIEMVILNGWTDIELQDADHNKGIVTIEHTFETTRSEKSFNQTMYINGKTVHYYYLTSIEKPYVCGYWTEDKYACCLTLFGDLASFEAFLKDLTFEKIIIPQSGEG